MLLSERTATELAALFGADSDDVAVQLAYLYERAGQASEAIRYLQQAGDRALRLSAYEEAIAHFRHALSLLGALPESDVRHRQELGLQIGLSKALQLTLGYPAIEVQEAHEQAMRLGRALGNPPEIVALLGRSAHLHTTLGRHRKARAIAGELLDLALAREDRTCCSKRTPRKEFGLPARRVARRTGVLRKRALTVRWQARLSPDLCIRNRAWCTHRRVCRVRRLVHRTVRTRACTTGASHTYRTEQRACPHAGVRPRVHRCTGKPAARRRCNEATGRRSGDDQRRARLPADAQPGTGATRRSLSMSGSPERGMALFGAAIEQARHTRVQLLLPYVGGLQAEIYRQQGQIQAALRTIDQAIELAAQNKGARLPP